MESYGTAGKHGLPKAPGLFFLSGSIMVFLTVAEGAAIYLSPNAYKSVLDGQ